MAVPSRSLLLLLLLLLLLSQSPAATAFQLPVDEPLPGGATCNKAGLDLLAWHDGAEMLGLLRGRAFNQTATTYERLPATARAGEGPGGKGPVRSSIWELQTQPAGQFLQFTTDASCIFARYTIASTNIAMWHFPSTGVAGMDLYAWDEGNATWRWTGTSHPKFPQTQSKLASLSCPPAGCKPRAYRLHLPTYMATSNISIGIDHAAMIAPDASHLGREKPIVWCAKRLFCVLSCPLCLSRVGLGKLIVSKRAPFFRRYGTSILQGGVASRPGQVNTHIVSRALEVSEKAPPPLFPVVFSCPGGRPGERAAGGTAARKKHHLPRQARDNKMVGSENSKTTWRFFFSDRDFQLRLLRQRCEKRHFLRHLYI
jgi:hypothetical protein